jgi:hypothetical protein
LVAYPRGLELTRQLEAGGQPLSHFSDWPRQLSNTAKHQMGGLNQWTKKEEPADAEQSQQFKICISA